MHTLVAEKICKRGTVMPQTLLPIFPKEATQINELLSFSKRDGTVWYFHGCLPVFSHAETDYRCFNMFTSQLVDSGQCKQVEIVRAFGVSPISVKRHVKKFRSGGASAFFLNRKTRSSTVFTPDVLNRAQELFDQGESREEVADTFNIKQDTLYRALKEGRLVEHKKKLPEQK